MPTCVLHDIINKSVPIIRSLNLYSRSPPRNLRVCSAQSLGVVCDARRFRDIIPELDDSRVHLDQPCETIDDAIRTKVDDGVVRRRKLLLQGRDRGLERLEAACLSLVQQRDGGSE